MERLSKTFFKVGFILCIVSFVSCIILAICSFASIPVVDYFFKALVEAGKMSEDDAQIAMISVTSGCISCGIIFLLLIPLYIVTANYANKAYKDGNRGLYVANIVLGALSGTYFLLAAGVLALIALNRKERNVVE